MVLSAMVFPFFLAEPRHRRVSSCAKGSRPWTPSSLDAEAEGRLAETGAKRKGIGEMGIEPWCFVCEDVPNPSPMMSWK